MKCSKKLRHESSGPLMSAGFVLLIMCALYAGFSQYPFGAQNIAWCDMNQQTIPLLINFKNILLGKDSILLSMGHAGGMNAWGVFFFFTASPFSFLTLLVNDADMTAFMNILVMLKMAAAAAAATLFFETYFGTNGKVINVFLGVVYGMCGYSMMFYQNVIWLDMMYLLPLIVMALRRLKEAGKPLPYIITLSAAVIINYYISYMVILFIVLISLLYLFLCMEKKQRARPVFLFAFSSVTAGLIAAPIWLPSLVQYFASARGTDLIYSLSSGHILGYYHTSWPLLFCTPLIFAAIPFVSLKKGNRREGVFALSLFAMMLAAICFEPINKMWHTGNYMSFPFRYGFITVFAGLLVTCVALRGMEPDVAQPRRGTKYYTWAVFAATAYALYAAGKYLRTENPQITSYTRTLWGNESSFRSLLLCFLIGVVCFAIPFALYKVGHMSKRVFALFMGVLILISCAFNFQIYMGSVEGDDTEFRAFTEISGKIDDDSFYRVKFNEKMIDVNMMGAMGYNSLSHYTSLTDRDFMFAMKKLGYSSYWMEVNSNGGTAFTDALLSNNYTVSASREGSSPVFNLNKNAISFPAALYARTDPADLSTLPDMERMELQNLLYQTLFGGDRLFDRYEPCDISGATVEKTDDYKLALEGNQNGHITYRIDVSGRQMLYFDCFRAISNRLSEDTYASFSVRVNGRQLAGNYPSQANNGILCLGEFADETVSIELECKKDVLMQSFGVYGLDMSKLIALSHAVRGADIEVRGNTVQAGYHADADGYLYLPLPFNVGYSARVNGKTAEIFKTADCFMAVAVSAGANNIELTFLPQGLLPGMLLGLMGLLMLAGYFVFEKKNVFGRLEAGCKIVRLVTIAALFAILAAVYIFPMTVYFWGMLF